MRQIDISVCIQPVEDSGERSETEGVLGLTGAASHPALRATFPRRVKASAVAVQFPAEAKSCLPGSQPSPLGELARERLRGFIPRKKAAAPGTVQRLVYNIKVSQFSFAA